MSKERGIALCNELVLATMEDRKTKTRRLMNPQPKRVHANYADGSIETELLFRDGDQRIHCPHGKPGDVLYVKEGYRISYGAEGYVHGHYVADQHRFALKLTDREFALWEQRQYPNRATPGRFMYKSLARTRLKITEVRAERLQDITAGDAIAEGITPNDGPDGDPTWQFMQLWDRLNGKRPGAAWASNPYVWVISYRRIKP